MANGLGFTINILAGLIVAIFGTILTKSVEYDYHYCDDDECEDTTVVCEEDSYCRFYCGIHECRNSILNAYYAKSLLLYSSDYFGIDSTTIYGPYDITNGITDSNVRLTCNHVWSCEDSNIYFQFNNETKIICSEDYACDNNNITINYVNYFRFECEDDRRGCTYNNWLLNEINLAVFYIDGGFGSEYSIINTNILFIICGYYYYPSASNSYYGGCEESVFKLDNVCFAAIGFTDVYEYCKNTEFEITNVENMYVTSNAWNCICNYDFYEGAKRIHIDSSTLYNWHSEDMITLEEIQNCTNYERGILTVNNYNPVSINDTFEDYVYDYSSCADLTHLSNLTNLSIIPYSPSKNKNKNNNNNNINGDDVFAAIIGITATIVIMILQCFGKEIYDCCCKKPCGKLLKCFKTSNNNQESEIEQNIMDHARKLELMKQFKRYQFYPLVIFQISLFVEDFFAFFRYDKDTYTEQAYGLIVIIYSLACAGINLFALWKVPRDARETFVTFFSIGWEIGQAYGFWYITGKKYIYVFGGIAIVQIILRIFPWLHNCGSGKTVKTSNFLQNVASDHAMYKQSKMQMQLCAMQIPYLYFAVQSPFRKEWYDVVLTIYIWVVTCYGEMDDITLNEAFSTKCITMLFEQASAKFNIDTTDDNAIKQLNETQRSQLYLFYVQGILSWKVQLGGRYYISFTIGFVFTAIAFFILMLCLQFMYYPQLIPDKTSTFDFGWLTFVFFAYVVYICKCCSACFGKND